MYRSTALFALLGAAAAEVMVSCPDPLPEATTCVRVGMTYPGKGFFTAEGAWHLNGTLLWAEQVNERAAAAEPESKDSLFYVQLTAYDDESSNDIITTTYTSMIENDEADYFLAPYASSKTKVARDVVDPAGFIMIAGNAADDDVYSEDFPRLFGVGTRATLYAQPGLELLKSKGATSASILQSARSFSVLQATGAKDRLDELDFTLKGDVETYTPGSRDIPRNDTALMEILQRIADEDADVFLSFSLLGDGVDIVEMLFNNTDYRPRAMFLSSAASNQDTVDAIGARAEGLLSFSQWRPHETYIGEFFGTADEFEALYEGRFGARDGPPEHYAAGAAAAGTVLLHAIREAASNSTADILSELNTLDITTFYGPVSFDASGQNNVKPMITTQVFNGDVEVVAPLDQKDVELVYPLRYDTGAAHTNGVRALSAVLVGLVAVLMF